jgi:hypothetical protein
MYAKNLVCTMEFLPDFGFAENTLRAPGSLAARNTTMLLQFIP